MARINNIETWERFKKSDIWLDLSDILKERLEQVRDGLEQTKDYDELCRLQGASDQLRYLLSLIDLTIVSLNNGDSNE